MILVGSLHIPFRQKPRVIVFSWRLSFDKRGGLTASARLGHPGDCSISARTWITESLSDGDQRNEREENGKQDRQIWFEAHLG